MNKIIFLDVDGVLNNKYTFIENHGYKMAFYYANVNSKLLEIDYYKLQLLKKIIKETGASVVISSCLRRNRNYYLLVELLLNNGIDVIGETPYINSNRGKEVSEYLKYNEVDDYIILDDESFDLKDHCENLVITELFYGGLTEDVADDIIRKLK